MGWLVIFDGRLGVICCIFVSYMAMWRLTAFVSVIKQRVKAWNQEDSTPSEVPCCQSQPILQGHSLATLWGQWGWLQPSGLLPPKGLEARSNLAVLWLYPVCGPCSSGTDAGIISSMPLYLVSTTSCMNFCKCTPASSFNSVRDIMVVWRCWFVSGKVVTSVSRWWLSIPSLSRMSNTRWWKRSILQCLQGLPETSLHFYTLDFISTMFLRCNTRGW